MKTIFGILILAGLCARAELPSYDAELTTFAYPYDVKFFEFEGQQQKLKMAYMDVTPAKPNGQTVMLLHGKNFSGFYWEPTIRLLTDKGYRVVVPDQIGFGKSTKPSSYQFSFHGLAENTKRWLDHLQIGKVAVVGHSMGGMLAARFARMYPEATTKLVLVNPIGLEDLRGPVPYTGLAKAYEQELKTTAESIREYQKQAYYAGEWKPEYEALIGAASGWTRHKDYPKVAWNAALTSEMVYTQPVIQEFPLIKVRTLLIIGLRDRTAPGRHAADPKVAATLGDYPKLGRAAARAIPKAKLVELKGVGHVPQLESFPEYAKALTDFLAL
ncbi:MAG: alpha/beta hydrolase [Bdellovibrionaceae bacterium]|nr:alpha/beta hydrolase [Pseudobdellovibrionaceae bacterium]